MPGYLAGSLTYLSVLDNVLYFPLEFQSITFLPSVKPFVCPSGPSTFLVCVCVCVSACLCLSGPSICLSV